METKSDTIALTLKGNEELKTELGGAQPGDVIELVLTVTVSAVDDEKFEAAIDDVLVEGAVETEEDESESETDEEDEDPAMVVMLAKKKTEK